MKLYQCFKRVRAAKITAVPDIRLNPEHTKFVLMVDHTKPEVVTREWMEKHKPIAGGYLVQYEDGYQSFSPAAAFEAGYADVSSLPTKVTKEALEARIATVAFEVRPDGRTTVCEITMVNGFSVRGESSAAVEEEFREDFGKNYAYQKALDAAWAFEGYLLREKRFQAGLIKPQAAAPVVRAETLPDYPAPAAHPQLAPSCSE